MGTWRTRTQAEDPANAKAPRVGLRKRQEAWGIGGKIEVRAWPGGRGLVLCTLGSHRGRRVFRGCPVQGEWGSLGAHSAVEGRGIDPYPLCRKGVSTRSWEGSERARWVRQHNSYGVYRQQVLL